jgi:hypothetical protein
MKPVAVSAGPRGTFSKADWQKIKQILASIGVDLDSARMSAHFEARSEGIYQYSSSRHPWLSAGPEWRLDEVLQRMVYFHTLSEPKTSKQWAKKLEKALAATEKARTALHFVRLAPINYPDNAMRSDAARDRTLDDLMTGKAADLRARITKLQAIDSRGQSALTPLAKYCRELTDLWRALVGPGKPLHKKLLGQFLLACSRPLFRNMSARELGQRIDSFLSNL